jgi:hypothetical protein
MAKLLSVVMIASLSLTACGNKDKDKDKDKGKGGSGEPTYAKIDCPKMLDHFSEIVVAEKSKGLNAEQAAAIKKAVADGRDNAIAQCEKEKDTTKKLTVDQYDCLMKANDAQSMAACVPQQ